MVNPVPGDWGWTDGAAGLDWAYNSDPKAHNYSLAYARGRQLGLSHEDAVQSAQRQTYGRVLSQYPQPESERNRQWSTAPLSSPLPALQAVIEQAEQSAPPQGVSGRRMAMRFGVPALGVLLGLYGISALSQPEAEVRQEEYVGGAY